jgi:hypothetical protein
VGEAKRPGTRSATTGAADRQSMLGPPNASIIGKLKLPAPTSTTEIED